MSTSFVDTSLLGVAISLPIIATTSVMLRIIANRRRGTSGLAGDDWAILATLLLCWAHSVNTIVAGCLGGINTITVPPYEYVNIALRTLWISSYFLVTALFTVKISILIFYLRIFSISERFRKACYLMMIVLTLWWISAMICVILSTEPIDAAWNNAISARHRFDYNTWYLSYSALSIFFDVAILCFPLPMIKTLRVDRKRKISIIGIFWLGGFVCVSAVVRFVLLYYSIYRVTDFGKNDYSEYTRAFIWAEVEPNTAVIAACLPTYGPLFMEGGLVPRIRGSIRTMMGRMRSSGHDEKSPGSTEATAVGYYQLDKVTSNSKNSADIHSKRCTMEQTTFTSELDRINSNTSVNEEAPKSPIPS